MILEYLSYSLAIFILSLIWEYGYLLHDNFNRTLGYHRPVKRLVLIALFFPYFFAKKIYEVIAK